MPRLFLLLLMLILPATNASAKECNLSLQPVQNGACPAGAVGSASHNPDFDGGTINPHSDGRSAVDAFGHCRYIGSQDDKPQFVPFGNAEEWHAYLTNHPHGIYLLQCARGGALLVPPNFGHDAASNMCAKLPPPQNTIAPYMPVNAAKDFVAPPITYACKSNDGTDFTEVAQATLTPHDSGYGPSDELGWKVSKMLFTYDAICGPATGVITKTAPTTGLCSVGLPSAIIGSGPFSWVCASGTGGGHNRTCSTGTPCEMQPTTQGACRCEEGTCYKPVYWSDTCGHSGIDKSQLCDNPEPAFKPLPPTDEDNPQFNPNTPSPYAHDMR